MRNAIQLLGVVLVLQGISGAIDHLAVQPFFGALLNFFNRFALPRIDALSGYELLANLGLAALGLIVLTAASWGEPSP
jgi:hypothetical protein